MRAKQGWIQHQAQAGRTGVIPPKRNCKIRRDYDKELYKSRYLIENLLFNIMKLCAIAACCDKTARNILVAVQLAASAIWLN